MSDLPPKVLVVRLGAIGDVTNALVVASALRAESPAPEVGWVVHDLARPLSPAQLDERTQALPPAEADALRAENAAQVEQLGERIAELEARLAAKG